MNAAVKIRPIDDIVFVEAEEGATQGGIILANHKQHVGRVVAVGPGKLRRGQDGKEFRDTPDVVVGDRVLFSWRAGMEEKVDGRDLLVMREPDIMAIIPDDAYVGPTENRKAWNV
jgi:chaperonin GroES